MEPGTALEMALEMAPGTALKTAPIFNSSNSKHREVLFSAG